MKMMVKVLAVLLIAVMGISGIAAMAEGMIQTTGNVNVRSGAGLDYAKKCSVGAGKTFTYDKTAKDNRGVIWYRVVKNGKTGWISSMYAKQVSGNSKGASTQGKVVATGIVNIRKAPNLEGELVGGLKKGSTATYLNETAKDNRGVTWFKVKQNGKTGWVSSMYSKLG